MLSTFSQKPLKSWKDYIPYRISQNSQTLTDFYSLYESLIEDYRENRVAFHIHLFSQAHGRSDSDACCLILSETKGLDITSARPGELEFNWQNIKNRHERPSMFVDICQLVQDKKRMVIRPLRVGMVWLQRLNDCDRIFLDSVKPVTSEFFFEEFTRCADRELVSFNGFLVRSQNKLFYKVVKRGAEVLDTQPREISDPGRRLTTLFKSQPQPISALFCVSHNSARFTVNVKPNFPNERLEVIVSPVHLLVDKLH